MSWLKLAQDDFEMDGKVSVGESTKQLLRGLEQKRIVVLKHKDIDEMAANGLIDAKVKAVINAAPMMSGLFPTLGPLILLKSGIPLFDMAEDDFVYFKTGTQVQIKKKDWQSHTFTVQWNEHCISINQFTKKDWEEKMRQAEMNLSHQLSEFIDNTLYYAKQEKDFVIQPLALPALKKNMNKKHVVVVVRGSGYKNDLKAIQDYIEDYQPVLIGVDGGADALIEYGYKPDIIVGDMDSISDEALCSDGEIIVHAYLDGRAPGMERVSKLNLQAHTISAKGTSEDIAMLIAYQNNAELIVTLGTHTHMIDFLSKGRKGMASTLLVRMKIGAKLIDAKGVSKLYQRRIKWKQLWFIPAASMFPLLMLGFIHPGFRQFMDMLWIYVKLMVTRV